MSLGPETKRLFIEKGRNLTRNDLFSMQVKIAIAKSNLNINTRTYWVVLATHIIFH